MLAGLRNDGLYPALHAGHTNIYDDRRRRELGGAAFDPVRQILYANTSYAIHIVKLMPQAEVGGYTPPPGISGGSAARRLR